MNNRLTAIPLALILLASLSSCGASNEASCESFESAYNAADLRDKYLYTMQDSYTAAVEKLGKAAEDTSVDASGDLKVHLGSYSELTRQYIDDRNPQSDSSRNKMSTVDKRGRLNDKKDAIVDSCEESGNPIELEEDHPRN